MRADNQDTASMLPMMPSSRGEDPGSGIKFNKRRFSKQYKIHELLSPNAVIHLNNDKQKSLTSRGPQFSQIDRNVTYREGPFNQVRNSMNLDSHETKASNQNPPLRTAIPSSRNI